MLAGTVVEGGSRRGPMGRRPGCCQEAGVPGQGPRGGDRRAKPPSLPCRLRAGLQRGDVEARPAPWHSCIELQFMVTRLDIQSKTQGSAGSRANSALLWVLPLGLLGNPYALCLPSATELVVRKRGG